MTDVVVYTLGWDQDRAVKPGEQSNAQINSRIYVDGHELKQATGIEVEANGNDFLTVKVGICPSSLTFIELDEDEWKLDDVTTRTDVVMRDA